MKCPHCEREMKNGYFRAVDQPIQWIPEGGKPSNWRTGVAKGAVVLSEESFWKGYRADAYYCPGCKIVIVPVK